MELFAMVSMLPLWAHKAAALLAHHTATGFTHCTDRHFGSAWAEILALQDKEELAALLKRLQESGDAYNDIESLTCITLRDMLSEKGYHYDNPTLYRVLSWRVMPWGDGARVELRAEVPKKAKTHYFVATFTGDAAGKGNWEVGSSSKETSGYPVDLATLKAGLECLEGLLGQATADWAALERLAQAVVEYDMNRLASDIYCTFGHEVFDAVKNGIFDFGERKQWSAEGYSQFLRILFS